MGENGGAVHLERKLRLRLEPSPPLPTALRRRNSIATSTAVVPSAAKPPAQSLSFPIGTAAAHPPLPPPLDLSGHAFPPYTSLRDLLPPSPTASSAAAAAGGSPTAAACSSYEISIRNRLVNRAAWAYLRPTSASPDPTGPTSSAASGSASPPASGSSAGPSAGSPASCCRSAPGDSRGPPA